MQKFLKIYGSFTNIDPNSNETIPNPFKYVGRYGVITDLPDLIYMQIRYYLPTLGRFFQVDLMGYHDNLNLYIYTDNNPINFIDPAGLSKNFTKGMYIFQKVSGDTLHGGPHWHVYKRIGKQLLARVGLDGKVLTGNLPKTALKIMKAKGLIKMLSIIGWALEILGLEGCVPKKREQKI